MLERISQERIRGTRQKRTKGNAGNLYEFWIRFKFNVRRMMHLMQNSVEAVMSYITVHILA